MVCFALGGGGGTRATEFSEIIESTDGGKSWRKSLSNKIDPGTGNIACATSATCLIEDGGTNTVKATTDSGRAWTIRPLPSGPLGFREVVCPSTNVCYVTTNDGILATTDSGTSWASQTLPPNSVGPTALTCPSVSTCYVIEGTDAHGPAEVVSTNNGGSTWTVLASLPVSKISCPSTTTCFAIGIDTEVSTDSGHTWKSGQGSSESNDVNSMDCVSTTTCYAVGGIGSFGYATTDGGNTWTAETFPSGTKPELSGIACTSTTSCIAVGQDDNCYNEGDDPCPAGTFVVLVTGNGGGLWNGYTIPADDNLDAVACPSDGSCYAVGFFGGADGYAGGGDGVILSSSDLGIEWSNQAIPAVTGELSSISCPSATTCFAVGEGLGDVGALILKMTPSQN